MKCDNAIRLNIKTLFGWHTLIITRIFSNVVTIAYEHRFVVFDLRHLKDVVSYKLYQSNRIKCGNTTWLNMKTLGWFTYLDHHLNILGCGNTCLWILILVVFDLRHSKNIVPYKCYQYHLWNAIIPLDWIERHLVHIIRSLELSWMW